MAPRSRLTIDLLVEEARSFCQSESKVLIPSLYGVTDGKAVGTFIEHKFQDRLSAKYECDVGSSANGIDLPSDALNADIKVTSLKQPQSSCPFKNARQKIFGLGYNLLVFVYKKTDHRRRRAAQLNFVSCSFIHAHRTADYQTTKALRQMHENHANAEEVIAYLNDRNLPADEITMAKLAEEILSSPPNQGYLTISNALQWRLQYSRVVELAESVEGIVPIIRDPEKQ
ncbi:MAG TPA: restriction endonuclease [bacterium]|nr:restriction endonuclease [bacterium]